jgi:hypothetical protein
MASRHILAFGPTLYLTNRPTVCAADATDSSSDNVLSARNLKHIPAVRLVHLRADLEQITSASLDQLNVQSLQTLTLERPHTSLDSKVPLYLVGDTHVSVSRLTQFLQAAPLKKITCAGVASKNVMRAVEQTFFKDKFTPSNKEDSSQSYTPQIEEFILQVGLLASHTVLYWTSMPTSLRRLELTPMSGLFDEDIAKFVPFFTHAPQQASGRKLLQHLTLHIGWSLEDDTWAELTASLSGIASLNLKFRELRDRSSGLPHTQVFAWNPTHRQHLECLSLDQVKLEWTGVVHLCSPTLHTLQLHNVWDSKLRQETFDLKCSTLPQSTLRELLLDSVHLLLQLRTHCAHLLKNVHTFALMREQVHTDTLDRATVRQQVSKALTVLNCMPNIRYLKFEGEVRPSDMATMWIANLTLDHLVISNPCAWHTTCLAYLYSLKPKQVCVGRMLTQIETRQDFLDNCARIGIKAQILDQ